VDRQVVRKKNDHLLTSRAAGVFSVRFVFVFVATAPHSFA
jgi:hypothetical protein